MGVAVTITNLTITQCSLIPNASNLDNRLKFNSLYV